MEFVVDKMTQEQAFLRDLRFPLPVSFQRGCPFWGINSKPVGGRSSETSSHPIDMNNDNNKYASSIVTDTIFEVICLQV
jgi:hypothetical protein